MNNKQIKKIFLFCAANNAIIIMVNKILVTRS